MLLLFFTLGIGVNISPQKKVDPLIVLDQFEYEQVSEKKINDETVHFFLLLLLLLLSICLNLYVCA